MAKTAKIVLGGEEYKVHPFNLNELEEVQDIAEGNAKNLRSVIKVLKIVMRRAHPQAEGGMIEASPKEINAAMSVILELNGMTPSADPQGAEQAAA